MPGAEDPALTDFQTINTELAPRSLDVISLYQSFSEPVWYSSYPTWAAELGASMMIDWIPTGTVSSATSGTYDTYLATSAATIKALGVPVIIRMAYEMNGNFGAAYGNGQETAAGFVSGWQYIYDKVVVTGGATNALFFWSPNIWNQGATTIVDPTPWYPGDAYCSIVGVDGYFTVADTTVLTPVQLYLQNYNQLMAMSANPFGFGECGCAAQSRLSPIGGKAGWFNLFFEMIQAQMPRCVFMDYYNRVDGSDDYTISSSGADAAALDAFINGVTSFPFVTSTAPVLVP
jgi:hypothetical protein